MCGIWAIFGSDVDVSCQCQCMRKINHRGPDAFRTESVKDFPGTCIGFQWLSIVDDLRGMQPIRLYTHPHVWLIYNGEIYNHQHLEKEYDFQCSTSGDGECIIHLYEMGGAEFAARHLDGVFAFCILDTKKRRVFLGRDTFGVRPMFTMYKEDDGFLGLCSEAKGLVGLTHGSSDGEIKPFPPGHIEEYEFDHRSKPKFIDRTRFNSIGVDPRYPTLCPTIVDKNVRENIYNLLNDAVRKRMMTVRRIGCLLSGGLDSSLITSLVVKNAKELGLPYKIQTFSIGMEGSTDLKFARKVADYLGTEHHEVVFTPEEGIAAVEDVVYHLESYDITTIRASVGMYLVSKYVREKTDSIVIFSGEGADEVAQGYIYFHKAPSVGDADAESHRLLEDLYMYDVLRGDRTTAAASLELRAPLLDHKFTSYYLSLPATERSPQEGVEKHLLRSAFADRDALPADVLWRPKEAFSDGVSSLTKSWYEVLQEFIESQINDEEVESSMGCYTINPPTTKEALYYRRLFHKYYPGRDSWIPYYWMPKWINASDPSARTLKHYKQS